MDDQEQYRCSTRSADRRRDHRLQNRYLQRNQYEKNQAERQRDLSDTAREQPVVAAQPLQIQPRAKLEQDEPQGDLEHQTRIAEHLRIEQPESARSHEQTRNGVAADPGQHEDTPEQFAAREAEEQNQRDHHHIAERGRKVREEREIAQARDQNGRKSAATSGAILSSSGAGKALRSCEIAALKNESTHQKTSNVRTERRSRRMRDSRSSTLMPHARHKASATPSMS